MKHKSGFVSIIGYPNAGKSTLVNALVGEKLSIVNAKVQTTRDRILGIYNSENYQIVFSDTPGIIDPKSINSKKNDELCNVIIICRLRFGSLCL